jgi:hypothetical protein
MEDSTSDGITVITGTSSELQALADAETILSVAENFYRTTEARSVKVFRDDRLAKCPRLKRCVNLYVRCAGTEQVFLAADAQTARLYGSSPQVLKPQVLAFYRTRTGEPRVQAYCTQISVGIAGEKIRRELAQ